MNRLWIPLVYLLLFALAVPWYWSLIDAWQQSADGAAGMSWGDRPGWFGLPWWFCTSVLVSAIISIFTALVITFGWKIDPGDKTANSSLPTPYRPGDKTADSSSAPAYRSTDSYKQT